MEANRQRSVYRFVLRRANNGWLTPNALIRGWGDRLAFPTRSILSLKPRSRTLALDSLNKPVAAFELKRNPDLVSKKPHLNNHNRGDAHSNSKMPKQSPRLASDFSGFLIKR